MSVKRAESGSAPSPRFGSRFPVCGLGANGRRRPLSAQPAPYRSRMKRPTSLGRACPVPGPPGEKAECADPDNRQRRRRRERNPIGLSLVLIAGHWKYLSNHGGCPSGNDPRWCRPRSGRPHRVHRGTPNGRGGRPRPARPAPPDPLRSPPPSGQPSAEPPTPRRTP